MDIQILSNYYPDWVKNRIKYIHKFYPPSFFNNKKILELGSHKGDIGAYFQSLGADVTSVEGRTENIKESNRLYPQLKVLQADLDVSEWGWGKFDIIINFGLFYHLLNHHEAHLVNCIKNCELMFFETILVDSHLDKLYPRKQYGVDQSLTDTAGTPTTTFVENIFKKCSVNFEKHSSELLNGGGHHYDWKDKHDESMDLYARRFWIVKQKTL